MIHNKNVRNRIRYINNNNALLFLQDFTRILERIILITDPLCLECKKLMRPLKTGVCVFFGKSNDNYGSYVSGDVFGCSKCGKQIVEGWGDYTGPVIIEDFVKNMRGTWIIFCEDGVEYNALNSDGVFKRNEIIRE